MNRVFNQYCGNPSEYSLISGTLIETYMTTPA
jgi:hypothetical protein